MKSKIIITGLLLFSILSCNKLDELTGDTRNIKIRIINYTSKKITGKTVVYYGAFTKDNNYVVIDSLEIYKTILPKEESTEDHKIYSDIYFPEEGRWRIDLDDVRDISDRGAFLLKLPNDALEMYFKEFDFLKGETIGREETPEVSIVSSDFPAE